MGERGARNEPATPADIEAMGRIVAEGIAAGALGFSTSRTLAHRAIDGEPVPGTFAAEDELFGIARAMGPGVFELAPAGALGEDLAAPAKEVEWMRRLAAETGRPVTFALTQNNVDPTAWRTVLELSQGVPGVRPQVHGRTVSVLLGFSTFHPFNFTPAWSSSGLALLPWRDQVARITADPALWAALVDDARALDDDGRELLNSPVLNYSDGTLDAVREMLLHPSSAFGLGDGGAHAGQTCDASTTTFLLSYWARDRAAGRLPVELAVHKLTQATASLYGLGDRGVLAPGFVGDLNVIDHAALQLHRPEKVEDLPGGAARFIQRADGYVATVKGGEVTFAGGEHTGALPGALLRGPR
jgi:N-acyl-D-aspartate/D-glutamate deacylase